MYGRRSPRERERGDMRDRGDSPHGLQRQGRSPKLKKQEKRVGGERDVGVSERVDGIEIGNTG